MNKVVPMFGGFPSALLLLQRGFGNLPAFYFSYRLVRSGGNISSRMEAVADDYRVVLARVVVKSV